MASTMHRVYCVQILCKIWGGQRKCVKFNGSIRGLGRRNPSEVPFRTYFKHKGEGLFLFGCLLNGMFSLCGFCWLADGFCFFLFLVLLIKSHHGTNQHALPFKGHELLLMGRHFGIIIHFLYTDQNTQTHTQTCIHTIPFKLSITECHEFSV